MLGGDPSQVVAPGEPVITPSDADTLAELTHRNGAVTRLDRSTEAVVHEAPEDEGPRVIVALGPGRTWHHTGPFDHPALYEAHTPSGTVTAHGAVFVVTCAADGSAHVRVVRGTAVVRGSMSGSVVVLDGQVVDLAAMGLVGAVRSEPATGEMAEWIEINEHVGDIDPQAGADADPDAVALAGSAPALAPAAAIEEPAGDPGPDPTENAAVIALRPRRRWLGRTLGAAALVAFAALLTVTFLAARNGDRSAGPAATTVPTTPPTTTPTTTSTTSASSSTTATGAAKATATGTACTQKGSTITYSGTLNNTGGRTSSFVVSATFTTGKGVRFATGSTTVSPVAPGKTASWSMVVTSSTDLRGTGASCDVSGVRPA
jgi:hypothetical protein